MNFFDSVGIKNKHFYDYIEKTSTYNEKKTHYKQFHFKTYLKERINGLDRDDENKIYGIRGINIKIKNKKQYEFMKSFSDTLINDNVDLIDGDYFSKYYEGTIITRRNLESGKPLFATHRKLDITNSKFNPHKLTFQEMFNEC